MASRIEKIGDATLYLGDCMEILPTLPKVDAVVTDPPYGIGYFHSGGGIGVGARRNALLPIHGDDKPFDPTPLLQLDCPVLLFGADHFKARLPDGGAWLCWDKHTGIGPNDSFADGEFAWANFKVKRNVIRFLWKGVACVKRGEDGGTRYHPTTKPVGLMKQCVAMLPEGSQLVLDPFMGSGTTGVACANLGRNFIGIEIEVRYFDIACERIDAAYRQQRLFA